MLEQRFRWLSGLEAGSSSDFERSVASNEKQACSSSDLACSVASKQARAVAAQTLQKASSSSDFERPVATERTLEQ